MRKKAKKIRIETVTETHLFMEPEISEDQGYLIVFIENTEYCFNHDHIVSVTVTKYEE